MKRNVITTEELRMLLAKNPHLSIKGDVNMSPEQKAVVKAVKGTHKFKSNLERDFYTHLWAELHSGKVARVEYEYHQIQLIEGVGIIGRNQESQSHYTPDFSVWTLEGKIDFYETKGRVNDGTELRLKIATALCLGHKFYYVTRAPKGGYNIKLRFPGVMSGKITLNVKKGEK